MNRTHKLYRDAIAIGTILIIIAMIVFSRFLPRLFSALSPLIFSLALFYLFKPLVKFFNKKLNVNLSVVLTFLIALTVFFGVIASIIPAIVQSIQAIIDLLYSTTPEEFLEVMESIPFVSDYFDTTSLEAFFQTIYAWIDQSLSFVISYIATIISSITGWFASLVISIMGILMAFYLLRDSVDSATSKVKLFIKSIFPKKIADFIIRIAELTDESIKRFLIGKLYTSLILGLLIFVVGFIVNITTSISIPYLPLLACLIAFGNLIPYVGSWLASVPCLLLCLLHGLPEAIAFLIILLCMQAIDNMIITPKVLGESVGLQPFWILVGITVVGGLTGSVIGMILSVPFVAVIITLAEERMSEYLENVTSQEQQEEQNIKEEQAKQD